MRFRAYLAGLTIFLGSAVLFCLEPTVGNTLLPFFGGSATVWVVCLAVFQVLLLLGYGYACLLPAGGFSRRFRFFHLVFLAVAVVALAGVAAYRSTFLSALSDASVPPFIGVCGAVLVLCAPIFILLSANATLVQVAGGGNYRLYAIGNLGSLVGLLSYPFLLEPHFTLSAQWRILACGAGAYGVCLTALFIRMPRMVPKPDSPPAVGHGTSIRPYVGLGVTSVWEIFFLAALSTFALNALTTHLCTDLTPLPFLWVLILGLYLVSYAVAYTDRGSRWGGMLFIPVAILSVWAFVTMGQYAGDHLSVQLFLGSGTAFFGGWMVHARLYRLRPAADRLPRYYLLIALGGAVGGILASVVAPCVLNVLGEYPVALAFLLAVAVTDGFDACVRRWPAVGSRMTRIGRFAVTGSVVLSVAGIVILAHAANGDVCVQKRNFYGISRVIRRVNTLADGRSYEANAFLCGATMHGFQPIVGTWKRQVGSTYYEVHSGGMAILRHPKRLAKKPLRVALAGMGIGTLAVFGERGDLFRFYEINPAVIDIATNDVYFSYVGKSFADVEIVAADARKALAHERTVGEAKWDVLVADVFSGDSVPPHTLTEEAFRLYLDRLAEDGILAFHLTNWHLDLLPVVKAAAKRFGLAMECLECRVQTPYGFDSLWAFLSRKPYGFCDKSHHTPVVPNRIRDMDLMKDERHALLPLIRKGGL